MKSGRVVLNADTSLFGVIRKRAQRLADAPPKRMTGVTLIDSVSLEEDYNSWTEGINGWKPVPKDHILQMWVSFFDTVYEADWYINHCENCEADEHYMEKPHEVFAAMRKIFGV